MGQCTHEHCPAAIAEYQSLRSSIDVRVRERTLSLVYSLTFLGAVMALGGKIPCNSLLLMVYPLFVVLFASQWAHYNQRITQMVLYIRDELETRTALNWYTSLFEKPSLTPDRSVHLAFMLLFFQAALAVFIGGEELRSLFARLPDAQPAFTFSRVLDEHLVRFALIADVASLWLLWTLFRRAVADSLARKQKPKPDVEQNAAAGGGAPGGKPP